MVGSKCRDFKNREVSNVNAPKINTEHPPGDFWKYAMRTVVIELPNIRVDVRMKCSHVPCRAYIYLQEHLQKNAEWNHRELHLIGIGVKKFEMCNKMTYATCLKRTLSCFGDYFRLSEKGKKFSDISFIFNFLQSLFTYTCLTQTFSGGTMSVTV